LGTTLIVLIILWQFSYVVVAFRRVYADGWIAAGAKAAVMVFVGFVAGNVLAILAFFLAIQVSIRTS
jgi:hypothetical protein